MAWTCNYVAQVPLRRRAGGVTIHECGQQHGGSKRQATKSRRAKSKELGRSGQLHNAKSLECGATQNAARHEPGAHAADPSCAFFRAARPAVLWSQGSPSFCSGYVVRSSQGIGADMFPAAHPPFSTFVCSCSPPPGASRPFYPPCHFSQSSCPWVVPFFWSRCTARARASCRCPAAIEREYDGPHTHIRRGGLVCSTLVVGSTV